MERTYGFCQGAKKISEQIDTYNVKFLIVGEAIFEEDKLFKEELIQLVEELHIKDKIIFTGYKDYIAEIIKDLDILVVPSESEPFGRVVIEGMAAQKAVIATNVGGPVEIIDNGQDGILIELKNVNELTEKLKLLILDDSERLRLGATAGDKVEKIFSINKHTKEVMKLYEQLLDK